MNANTSVSSKQTSPAVIAIFWAYVTIPLVWGVWSTLQKAMALFH
ncbi:MULTISPECIES: oxalate:formate antiporter [Oxalobacteraceae]|uniref:Oxalate:formate antiporter n=1 Tax=Herminiimonas contaminans TaxID=1111140 RepID=A0ABS0EXJ2_9BURK|nr:MULTISPECIES: oxalate:formate antiporter [Oxalobacteraceae]MBF8179571.1 oxalate:formate antiporter [Herminiimonas contaminans]